MKREFIFNIQPLKSRRQLLRNNPTPAEKVLWEKLRKKKLGFWFKRQFSIKAYVVDFYCPQLKLAIELDGEIHLKQVDYDIHRTRYLNALNITVLRFTNDEVMANVGEVTQKIKQHLSP